MKSNPAIAYEIRTLSNLLKRKAFEIVPPPEEDKFTEMQGQILGFLFDNQGRDLYQRDLEEQFVIRRSTASRFLKMLERRGLIKREPVSQDARLKKLVLTEAAIEGHELIVKKFEMVEKLASQGLTEAEKEQFVQLVNKIKKNLL